MAFPAIVTLGTENEKASDGLTGWITEIRIEQSLSKPTKFAIRFEDDICGDKMALADEQPLMVGNTVGVLVDEPSGGLQCLVRGPIVKVKNSVVIGGASSWFEIHGLDNRALLGRVGYKKEWTGLASSVADSIIGAYPDLDVATDVQPTEIEYDQQKNRLSQNGMDLAFIEKIAADNGYEFWVSYAPSAQPGPALPTSPVTYDIAETFNLKPSPEGEGPAPGSLPSLVPSSDLVLRVNVVEGVCSNVTKFDLDVDAERATRAYYARTGDDGETVYFDAADETDPLNADAVPITEVAGQTRTVLLPDDVPDDEKAIRARAILREQGWFVSATCSTSAMLYGGPIQAHDIVKVEGVAPQHDGAYHVTDVLHVIKANGHLMDLKMRRNEINLPTSSILQNSTVAAVNA